ncbi:hypothetical protein J4466_04650 [Candidatus Pacearchaeota archaeon]|nr:hypothetical protein [Candidatus Pacearchaeota archaeon]
MPNLWIVIIGWIFIFGGIFFFFKQKLTNNLANNSLPKIINYFIIALPVTLIEEFFTCEIGYLMCLGVIVPIFLGVFFILFFIQYFTKLNYLVYSSLFALFGLFNEFIIVDRIHNPLYANFTMAQWILLAIITLLIYFVMAILPTYYLQRKLKKQ